jgi:hypothetical protein
MDVLSTPGNELGADVVLTAWGRIDRFGTIGEHRAADPDAVKDLVCLVEQLGMAGTGCPAQAIG